ncbi:MAG: putative transporter small subunit [Gulosibacter sp.]
METFLMTAYVMVWPVIVAGTLAVIVGAFVRDWWKARKEGRDII